MFLVIVHSTTAKILRPVQSHKCGFRRRQLPLVEFLWHKSISVTNELENRGTYFFLHIHRRESRSDSSKGRYQLFYYNDLFFLSHFFQITFESAVDHPNQRDRPKILSFQVTRATITNVRSLEQSSRADLAKCVDSFHMGSLFFGTEFPSQSNDFYIVTQKFLDHISASDNIRNVPTQLDISSLENLVSFFSYYLSFV